MNEQTIFGVIKSVKLKATVKGGFSPYSDVILVQKTITQNGVYLPSSDNADGYSAVTVNVTQQDNNFIIKQSDNILKYNKLYLDDVYAVYAQNSTTQQNLEHLQNGSFLGGSGNIWRMNGGAIQPTATSWFRAMTFTQPITLTNETALKIKYSYTTSYTYRNFQVSLWENVDPSTILATSFGTGTLVSNYESIINTTSPAQSTSTVYTIDVSTLQGNTIWIHLFASDVIPLITEIWFE